MDEKLIRESLTGFDSVWTRVIQGRAAPPPPATALEEETSIQTLLSGELCAAQFTAALARVFQGEGRALLLRHAADAKRHARRLRGEYFIRTGLTAGQGGSCPGVTGKLTSLRSAMLQAERRAGMYGQAAEHTRHAELREAYTAFAAEEARHARELRALLLDSF